MQDLVIIGAGGFAREVAWLVEDCNAEKLQWNLRGFLDDDPQKHGLMLNGYPVLGGIDWLESHRSVVATLAIGSPFTREKVANRVSGLVSGFADLVHPEVRRSKFIEYGNGITICAGSIITTNIYLGDFLIANLDVTIGHDVRIGRFVTIAPGAHVSGNVTIEDLNDIGTGAVIIQGKKIGRGSVIGAGSVVVKDIPSNVTAVGVPAHPIKENAH